MIAASSTRPTFAPGLASAALPSARLFEERRRELDASCGPLSDAVLCVLSTAIELFAASLVLRGFGVPDDALESRALGLLDAARVLARRESLGGRH